MAVGWPGSQVGLVPGGYGVPYPAGVRPVVSQAFGSVLLGGSPYPNCRIVLSRESETNFTMTGQDCWTSNNSWRAVDRGTRNNGSVPIPSTEDRFTVQIRTNGGQVLVYLNGTMAEANATHSCQFDVLVDYPAKSIIGNSLYRLARVVAPSLNYLAFRGGEVANGTGSYDFRVVTKRLPPGLHTFTLIASKTLDISGTVIGAANPRAGSDNDGWIAFGAVEIPDTDKFPGILSNLAVSANLGHTVLVPGPNLSATGTPFQGAIPISGGALTEAEGFLNTSSTTFVTIDSMSHGAGSGWSNNRFTQRLFLKRGGPVLILVGLTVAENNVGEITCFDVRMDGVRLGGTNGLAQHGAQVSSGTGSAHIEYITRWLNPGWHLFELMGRVVSGTVTNIGLAGASAGTVNEGWLRMHCIGLA